MKIIKYEHRDEIFETRVEIRSDFISIEIMGEVNNFDYIKIPKKVFDMIIQYYQAK